jgi:hypothetical protein
MKDVQGDKAREMVGGGRKEGMEATLQTSNI